MATLGPSKEYLIDGTLGQDPAPTVTAAELDAHRLMSRWRHEFPDCLVDQVKRDVQSVLKLASRIDKGASKESDDGIYTACGEKVGTLTPLECCNETQD